MQAYDTQPDATQAVLSGRAYATLGGNTDDRLCRVEELRSSSPTSSSRRRAPIGRRRFRKDSVALRNQMQDALDCMKKDGTIAKLSEKWFGRKPTPTISAW